MSMRGIELWNFFVVKILFLILEKILKIDKLILKYFEVYEIPKINLKTCSDQSSTPLKNLLSEKLLGVRFNFIYQF